MVKKLLFAALLVAFSAAAFAQGTVIWSEDFNTFSTLPPGWTQSTNASDGGWKVGTTSAIGSQYFAIPSRAGNVAGTNDDKCNCNKANEILVTAPIDLSSQQSGADLRLLFDLFFYNATYGGATETLILRVSKDGGTTWTDLQELPGAGAWQNKTSVDISAYAGEPSVQFAFRYDDGGGWEYGAVLDNMSIVVADDVVRAGLSNVRLLRHITEIPGTLPIYGSGSYTHFPTGETARLRGTITNSGFPTITSFDAKATRGMDEWPVSFDNLDLAFGESATFYIEVPIAAGVNNFTLEISNVNGVGDDDPADNIGTRSVTGMTPVSGTKVVVEEATGTWCGWCPRGAIMVDYVSKKYPENAIGIAVHHGVSGYADPMEDLVTNYDDGIGAIIGGYPSGLVNRVHNDVDPGEFDQFALVEMAKQPKVSVSQDVAWDAATRTVTVVSALHFLEEMNGDFRIAVAYTEDGVKGTSTGYRQRNFYAGGGQGPMGGYENLADPVPAASMVYDHVARAIVGGFTGAPNSVPAANPAGSVMYYTSTYKVPAGYNIDNMHAITMLIDQTSGAIINAEQTGIPFVSTSASTLNNDAISVNMFPNPVQDEATLTVSLKETADLQVRVIDAFGRVVAERNYGTVSGKQYLPFQAGNLANGVYTLVATAKGQSVSKPFVIAR